MVEDNELAAMWERNEAHEAAEQIQAAVEKLDRGSGYCSLAISSPTLLTLQWCGPIPAAISEAVGSVRATTPMAVSIQQARYSLAELLRASDALWRRPEARAWGLRTTSPAPDGDGLQLGVPDNTRSVADWAALAGVEIAEITEENPVLF